MPQLFKKFAFGVIATVIIFAIASIFSITGECLLGIVGALWLILVNP